MSFFGGQPLAQNSYNPFTGSFVQTVGNNQSSTLNVFQPTATTGIFGQPTSSSGGSIFSQPTATSGGSILGQGTTTSSSNIFGNQSNIFQPTTTSTSNFFGQSQASQTSPGTSFFGQSQSAIGGNILGQANGSTNIFGNQSSIFQPTTTSTTNFFGQQQVSPGTNIFAQPVATGGTNIFSQTNSSSGTFLQSQPEVNTPQHTVQFTTETYAYEPWMEQAYNNALFENGKIPEIPPRF